MAIPALPGDFKEFLKSLNSNCVEYLLIGGYAVGIYGHIRATNDLDVWVRISPENAGRIERALHEFGFAAAGLTPDLFLARNNVVRMGVPTFELCYAEREVIQIEDMVVPAIGRAKDLADLESLPLGPDR